VFVTAATWGVGGGTITIEDTGRLVVRMCILRPWSCFISTAGRYSTIYRTDR